MEYTVPFPEVRETWIKAYKKEYVGFSPGNRETFEGYRQNCWNSKWSGDTADNIYEYFREGYHVPGLDLDMSLFPARKRKRPLANDCEGDFRYDSFISGDENCYTQWTNRESIPGLNVEFGFDFSAIVNAQVIADYSRWLCKLFFSLETAGIDAEIKAVNSASGVFKSNNARLDCAILVKKMGERADYLSWSALFSPGGFRLVVLFSLIMAAENKGETCSVGMGRPIGNGWDCRWDSETRKLVVKNNSMESGDFPEQLMTEKLSSALAEARG